MTLSVPLWVLLAFAAWTLVALLFTVGVYRWHRILTGRDALSHWRADLVQGPDWYQRAMRAHANCVENLVVYGAICVVIVAGGIEATILDRLAVVLLAARIAHTVTHVAFPQTDLVSGIRFVFFFVQLVCMIWMGAFIALQA
ncbi:MAG: MAPEG family protein [Xanthomonadales bacterium]|nr:MAPEG family protein [Xanthomonadales bacterium]